MDEDDATMEIRRDKNAYFSYLIFPIIYCNNNIEKRLGDFRLKVLTCY